MNKEEALLLCKKLGIKNVLYNEDGSITVRGDVDISNMGLNKIPIKFKTVGGRFNCCRNKLVSLENAPEKTGKSFFCAQNKLKNLKHSPKEIGGSFFCSDNPLEDIVDMPKKIKGRIYNYKSREFKSLKEEK